MNAGALSGLPGHPALGARADNVSRIPLGDAGDRHNSKSSLRPVALLALAGISLHFILQFVFHFPRQICLVPLYGVLLLGGLPLLAGLIRNALRGEFGADLLAGISIFTSVLMGQYLVGSIVVLMLAGGTALEEYASQRASFVLCALAKRMPQEAHRKSAGGMADVRLEQIDVGDLLVIYPHEICPVDGVVVEGQGGMNESILTGEPYELSKTPGAKVISGALNGETALTIQAKSLPMDSRYARIMRVMEETQQRRPRMRRLGDQLGAWYTPFAVLIALLAWGVSADPHRFLAVLVIATPCPLLIAIPVAVIGAISLAARQGIIVKNPAILEQIGSCRTFIFDRTGTLTYGRPTLVEIRCAPGFERTEVLRLAAGLELYSKHPLAHAILEAAEREHLDLESAADVRERPGEGLAGTVGGQAVVLTGRSRVTGHVVLPPMRPGLECLVFLNGVFAAALQFRDVPRNDSRDFVSHLKPRHDINRILLVSGDRDSEVQILADQVGIMEVHAAAAPEEKVIIVREETARQGTVFVGDGINDAPAMQAATVGVAFGQDCDVAEEAADAVVLDSSVGKLDELIHIGRRMRSIALQSAIAGMGLSVAGMILAALGYLPPIEGAIAQEVIDLLAVLNAVRMVLPFNDLRDF